MMMMSSSSLDLKVEYFGVCSSAAFFCWWMSAPPPVFLGCLSLLRLFTCLAGVREIGGLDPKAGVCPAPFLLALDDALFPQKRSSKRNWRKIAQVTHENNRQDMLLTQWCHKNRVDPPLSTIITHHQISFQHSSLLQRREIHTLRPMKIQASVTLLPSAIAALLLFFLSSSIPHHHHAAEAFVLPSTPSITKPILMSTTTPPTQLRAEIGETGVAFEHVAREWRCKVCKRKCIVTMIR